VPSLTSCRGSADDQQPPEVGIGEERAQQREGRDRPTGVIEEITGMSRGGEHGQELLKQEVERFWDPWPRDGTGGCFPMMCSTAGIDFD